MKTRPAFVSSKGLATCDRPGKDVHATEEGKPATRLGPVNNAKAIETQDAFVRLVDTGSPLGRLRRKAESLKAVEERYFDPTTGSREMAPQQRLALKARWALQPGTGPLVWRHVGQPDPKLPADGHQEIAFDAFNQVANLPPVFSKPEVSKLLRFHVVSKDELCLFHRTTAASCSGLLGATNHRDFFGGRLTEGVRFSHQDQEPALFTDLRPVGSTMTLSAGPSVVLKLKLPRFENAFVLDLKDPMTENAKKELLSVLTGDPDFFDAYKLAHIELSPSDVAAGVFVTYDPERDGVCTSIRCVGRQYANFDLFLNAVVCALKTRFGLPVDLMLFTHDSVDRAMGQAKNSSYAWAIVFDRGLLKTAEIEEAVLLDFAGFEADNPSDPGQQALSDDSRHVRLRHQSLSGIQRHPSLVEDLRLWLSPAVYTPFLREWTRDANHPAFDWARLDWRDFTRRIQENVIPRLVGLFDAEGYDQPAVGRAALEEFSRFLDESLGVQFGGGAERIRTAE